jgi:hypothetical protein
MIVQMRLRLLRKRHSSVVGFLTYLLIPAGSDGEFLGGKRLAGEICNYDCVWKCAKGREGTGLGSIPAQGHYYNVYSRSYSNQTRQALVSIDGSRRACQHVKLLVS